MPDPIAIARFIAGVETATAKGAFYQKEANRLLGDMVRWGFTSYEEPDASMPGPMDYLVGFLGSAAGAPYLEIERSDLPLVVQVEVSGIRAGKPTVLHYEAHDQSRRATTSFTALAALAVARGDLRPGIWAPEAWPRPAAFLSALLEDTHIRILHWRDGEPARPLVIHDAGGH